MKLRIVLQQEMWLLENEPSATVLKEKERRSRPGDGHAEQLRVDQTARDWWQTSVPAKCHHAWNTHLIRATCYNNSDGQHLKLHTRQMSPIYSLWDQGTPPFFFFRADILEESFSFTQTDGLCSHVQCIEKVKFAKPWWTATVFGYRSTRFNTLQQEQLLKHQFHLWVQEGCRRQCISLYLHMVRDLFSRAHSTEEKQESFGKLEFLPAFPLSLEIHADLVPQTGLHKQASLLTNCDSLVCYSIKISLFKTSILQLLYQNYNLL